MRIRLRAPEDSDAPPPPLPPFSRPSSAQASPHTPLGRLPQLDVRSPDFIEERLENLKRKPNWLTYLDQYVQAYPEDDDDEGAATIDNGSSEVETQEQDNEHVDASFLMVLTCAVAVMAMTPAWVLFFPFVRHKGPDFWPLGSPSLWELYKRSLALLCFVSLGLVMIYFTLCKELPEWSRDTWFTVQVALEDLLDAARSCRSAVSRGDEPAIRELCAPILVDSTVILLILSVVSSTHRRWGRVVLVALATLLYCDVPARINNSLQPLPEITAIDQPYALIDEEILVAFSGINLQPGGTIAWVSYWGCASTSPVESCELQYPSTFHLGYAAVTFTAIDHFIPCYRNPPNPRKAEEFRCFKHIRLPVKDKQSIPGWSKRAVKGAEGDAR